jgi:S1-C subfamily serine protease
VSRAIRRYGGLIVSCAAAAGCVDDGPLAAPREVEVRAAGCSLVDDLATGVVVDDGVVLTVAHALRGATTVRVDGIEARVVVIDHRIDAAAMTVPVDGPAVRIADHDVTGSATVGGRAVDVRGVVEATVEEPRDDTTYRRQALVLEGEIEPGQSGAAVVGPDGRLLGMVFAASRRTNGVAYAVAGSELRTFLDGAAARTEPVDLGSC